MENGYRKPERNRSMITTVELCINKKSGVHGSLEMIVSNPRSEQPVFYYWPLGHAGNLSGPQADDLTAVLVRELRDAAVMRLGIQDELPELL